MATEKLTDLLRKNKIVIIILLLVMLFGIRILFKLTNERKEVSSLLHQFAIAYDVPYIIKNGKVLEYQNENDWVDTGLVENASQIFGGERLCVLDSDGKLYFEKSIITEQDPLTTSYAIFMSQKALEINQNRPFKSINENVENLGFRALLQDGTILYQNQDDYSEYHMQNETPKYLSGNYILTEEGNVYYLKTEIINSYILIDESCVYNQHDIVSIDASETADRCIGLRKNGTIISWSGTEIKHEAEWKDIVRIEQGFNYAIGLNNKGQVQFAGYDENNTETTKDKLEVFPKVIDIAIYYNSIWGFTEDEKVIELDIK